MDQPDRPLVAHDRSRDERAHAGQEPERPRVGLGVLDEHRPLPAEDLRLVEPGPERRRLPHLLRELAELGGVRAALVDGLERQRAALEAEDGGALEAEVVAEGLRGLPEQGGERRACSQAPAGRCLRRCRAVRSSKLQLLARLEDVGIAGADPRRDVQVGELLHRTGDPRGWSCRGQACSWRCPTGSHPASPRRRWASAASPGAARRPSCGGETLGCASRCAGGPGARRGRGRAPASPRPGASRGRLSRGARRAAPRVAAQPGRAARRSARSHRRRRRCGLAREDRAGRRTDPEHPEERSACKSEVDACLEPSLASTTARRGRAR